MIGGALLAAELDAERAIREGVTLAAKIMSADNGQRQQEWGSPHFQMDLLSGQDGGRKWGQPPLPIRVSARARRLSIRVYPDARVEVVVPPRARPREVELFIATHREWIDSKRAMALRNRPEPQPFPPAAIELRMSAEHLAAAPGGRRGPVARWSKCRRSGDRSARHGRGLA